MQKVLFFLTVHARHRQTDRQTNGNAISITERLLRNARYNINRGGSILTSFAEVK